MELLFALILAALTLGLLPRLRPSLIGTLLLLLVTLVAGLYFVSDRGR